MIPHILVVDDHPQIRMLWTDIFEHAGWQVTPAIDGQDALDVYRTNPQAFSAVSLDMDMPRMGGQECLTQLLALNPELPVVIISSQEVDKQRRACPGARAWLQKPTDLRQLLSTFKELIGTVNMERAGIL